MALIPIVAAAAFVLLRLLPVLLVLIVALVMVGTLNPAVTWLERRHVRRGWAIALVFKPTSTTLGNDELAEAEYAERSRDVPAEDAAAIALEISEAQTKRETLTEDPGN